MPFSTAQKLEQLSVPTPLARELGSQLDTGAYNRSRLIESGLVPDLAKLVAGGSFDPVKAAVLGMVPPVAALVQSRSMPQLRAALKRVAAGTGQAKILAVGDSNTSGVGTGPAGANRRSTSYPSRLADLFSGTSAFVCGSAGSDNSIANYATYDPRNTFGATWTLGDSTLGGLVFNQANTSGDWVFVTPEAYDTMDVYGYFTNTTVVNGSFDGAAPTGYNISEFPALRRLTWTGSQATHSFAFRRVSGGSFRVVALHGYSQSSPKVSVMNAGMSGATSANISNTSTPIASANMIAAYAPDATIINIGINDAVSPDIPAFTAQVQVAIDMARPGDVVLCIPIPVDPSSIPQANQDLISAAIKQLALSNGVRLCDLRQRFVSFANANANGWMADARHPSGTGADQMAQAIYAALR